MQLAVILHDVASHLFLLRSAPVRIEPLLLLDVVTCEDDYIQTALIFGKSCGSGFLQIMCELRRICHMCHVIV